jgi:septal ring factor EnvC (AmiA/AmiB activator)
MMTMKGLFLIRVLLFFGIVTIFNFCPVLAETQSDLRESESSLKSAQERSDALKNQVQALESDIDSLSDELISTARSLQQHEAEDQRLSKEIATLENRQKSLTQVWTQDRRTIADLLMAMQRLRRTPPQALIFSPQNPIESAQGALIMARVVPTIQTRAQGLKNQIEQAQKIAYNLAHTRSQLQSNAKQLFSRKAELESLSLQKNKIFERTTQDLKDQQSEIRQIAAQAQDIRDLMKRLSDNQSRRQKKPKPEKTTAAWKGNGALILPVQGTILTGYEEPDDLGAPSKGLKISASSGAVAVAPMAGTVRFAGPFLNYGLMVIVEHANGYHSLIAGLEKIDTVVGQNVNGGEPLGFLRVAGSDNLGPNAYFELRHNGKPVNPVSLIRN